jgi:hypothetical protein
LVAVLAAAAAAMFVISEKYAPDEESVSGTIVPAQRYRANQIESDDVVLGDGSDADFESSRSLEVASGSGDRAEDRAEDRANER